ncbi:GNAT family N-acetyltransferase [Pedobacter nutrimenti]|jgi:ribosomal-protein-serine acetyltransferase|nr:GNAT family protein [Pedobacter nutrimenti]
MYENHMILDVNENIRLELTSLQHNEALFEVIDRNRAHLSRFLSWVEDMERPGHVKSYLQNCELLYRERKEVSFVIKNKDKVCGRIGLHHLNLQNKSGAIGYWLDKQAQGQGIITKSCRTLMAYGFNELGLNRIELKAATENAGSRAVPVRLGFTQEGILRQAELVNGKFLDLVLYAFLKQDWAG